MSSYIESNTYIQRRRKTWDGQGLLWQKWQYTNDNDHTTKYQNINIFNSKKQTREIHTSVTYCNDLKGRRDQRSINEGKFRSIKEK